MQQYLHKMITKSWILWLESIHQMHTNVGRLLYFLQSWFQIMNTNLLLSQYYRSSYMYADASSETAKFLIVIKTLKKFGKEKISTNINCNSWSVVFIFCQNKYLRLNRDFIHFQYSMTDLFFHINDIYINLNDFDELFLYLP